MTANEPSGHPVMTRERTYTWADPTLFAKAAQELAGLDFFAQLSNGMWPPPPINATTGIALVEVGDGRAVFELEPAEWHYNPICEGRVVSIGRRTATAEAQITDQAGRVIGHAVTTCLLMPIQS